MHSDRPRISPNNTGIVLREDSYKVDDEKSVKTPIHTLNTPIASSRLKPKETLLSRPEESEPEELARIRNSRKFFTINSRPVTREGTTFRDLIEGQNDISLDKLAKTEGSMGLSLEKERKYPKTFAHLGELKQKAAEFELMHRPTMPAPVKEAPLRNLIVGMLAEERQANPPKAGKKIMQFSTRFEHTGVMDVPEEETLFVKKEVSVGQSPYFREPNQHLSFANELNPYKNLKMDLPKSNFQEEVEDLLLKEKSPSSKGEGNMELEFPYNQIRSMNGDFAADLPEELNEVHSFIKVSPRDPPRQTVTSMDNSQRDNLDLD